MIKYIEGDLFPVIKNSNELIILPHVCNDKGAFGAGFVLPLKKNFPEAEANYFLIKHVLGNVGIAEVDNVVICNMIAQTLGGKRPLFYNHLAVCMNKVAQVIDMHQKKHPTLEIHAPAFGTNLSGGKWEVVLPLIEDCWIRPFRTPPLINIYYLPGTFLPPNQ